MIASAGIFSAFRPVAPAAESFDAPAPAVRETVVRERNLDRFTRINSRGSTSVTYIQSNVSKVVITGSPEFVDRMVTEVRGGTLHIGMEKGSYRNLDLRVTVYSPVLDEVVISGSGVFRDENGHISSGDVKYVSSGSGRFVIGKLKCGSFDCHLSGSGRLNVASLVCTDALLCSSGSGGITVENLVSRNDVNIRLSGSGYGLIDSVETGDLNMQISGSGSVKINGRARDVSVVISGSGSVMGDLEYRHLSPRISGSGRVRL